MAKKRRSQFASRAALEALVRFGPELSGLKELQRQAESNYMMGVNQARGTAAGTIGAIDQAVPRMQGIYDQAGANVQGAQSLLGADLANLGNVANNLKAGSALEQGGFAKGLNDQMAQALSGLQNQRVRAKEGEGFAIGNARDQFVSEIAKILGRKQDVRREKGAFTAATIHDLAEDEADRIFKAEQNEADRDIRRESNAETRRHNRENEANARDEEARLLAKEKADREKDKTKRETINGVPINTKDAHNSFRKSVRNATTLGHSLKGPGDKRSDVLYDLSHGVPAIKDESGKVLQPAIRKIDDPLVAEVAADRIFHGKITRATLKKLHKAGYSIKTLGYRYESGRSRVGPGPVNVNKDRSQRPGQVRPH